MKLTKHNREYCIALLMQSSSLNDLLGILKSICENLNLKNINPQLSQFRHFQFTFFGLMVKSRGLLEMMLLRTDFLRKSIDDFKEIHRELLKSYVAIDNAYTLVRKKKMIEGRNKIIECAEQYNKTHEKLEPLLVGLI